jgi:hypothetical protein
VVSPQARTDEKADENPGTTAERAENATRDCTFNYVAPAAAGRYDFQFGIGKFSQLLVHGYPSVARVCRFN